MAMTYDMMVQRRLMMAQAVANKIEANPDLLEIGRQRILHWKAIGSSRNTDEWSKIIDEGPQAVLTVLRGTSERCDSLRKLSPFLSLLTEEERSAIFRKFRPVK